MWAVGADTGHLFHPVERGVDAAAPRGLGADAVDAGVGAAAVGQFLQALIDALGHEIDRDRPGLPRHGEALGHGVDGDHPLGPQQEGAADGELRHRAAAPDGDGVAGFDLAELGTHVAGGEDVGQEEDLVVGEVVGHLDGAHVGVGDAQVFGLAARVAAQGVGVAEQPGGRVAPQELGRLMVGVAALARREQALLAKEALATGDGERHHDAIADFQVLHLGADLHDLTHRLVAHDVARHHAGDDSVIEVQVGAADGAGGDLDDGVALVLQLGVGDGVAAYVALAVPTECFHRFAPLVALATEFGGRGCRRAGVCERFAGGTPPVSGARRAYRLRRRPSAPIQRMAKPASAMTASGGRSAKRAGAAAMPIRSPAWETPR